MAFDAFLKINGVEGEATRTGHEKWIEIYSFSWGASNPTTLGTHGGGIGAGKASISTFNIMKKTDATSPLLFQNCCLGKHFPDAKLVLNKASGENKALDYLIYEFKEVFVESIQWSGSSGGDDAPTESVSFAFGSVKLSYTPQTATGSPGSPVRASWDLTKSQS